jgi:hypothetical protein
MIVFWIFNACFAVVLGVLFGEYEFDVDRFNEEREHDRILLKWVIAEGVQ